jgi:hypothetical protein
MIFLTNLQKRLTVLRYKYGWHFIWFVPSLWFAHFWFKLKCKVKAELYSYKLLWYRVRYPHIARMRKLAGLDKK